MLPEIRHHAEMLTLLAVLVLTADPVVCRTDADCAIVVNCSCG